MESHPKENTHFTIWFIQLAVANGPCLISPTRAGALLSDNVELILQGIDARRSSDGLDNDQPDYDSVASDEDPAQEATCGDSCNDSRTKVDDFLV